MEENVGNFKIAMNDIFLREIVESAENVSDNGLSFAFGEVVLLPKFGLQVASVAEFGDDVSVIFGGVDFVECEYIGEVPHGFKDLDF